MKWAAWMTLGLSMTCSSSGWSQSDDCSLAGLITGTTTLQVDTSVLTTSALNSNHPDEIIEQDGFVLWNNTPGNRDVLIEWTSPQFEPRLAVYWNAMSLGCTFSSSRSFRDSAGGFTTRITIRRSHGNLPEMLIQFGSSGGGGLGTLVIQEGPDCSEFYTGPTEPNDSCTTAFDLPLGVTRDLFVGFLLDEDYFKITIPPGKQARVDVTQYGASSIDGLIYTYLDCSGSSSLGGSFFSETAIANTDVVPKDVFLRYQSYEVFGVFCFDYDLTHSIETSPCSPASTDYGEPNDDCGQATPIQEGFYDGAVLSQGDRDFYAFTVPAGAQIRSSLRSENSLLMFDQVLRGASSPSCGSGTGGTNLGQTLGFGQITWTNTSSVPRDVILEAALSPTTIATCGEYRLFLNGPTSTPRFFGQSVCTFEASNSTGYATVLSGGFSSPTGSGLHLEATQGPSGEFGYVLVGTDENADGIFLSQGLLCLATGAGQPIGRYNWAGSPLNSIGQFDAQGVLQSQFGNSSIGSGFDVPSISPIDGSTIAAGQSLTFQLWHRDTGGAANFSNTVQANF